VIQGRRQRVARLEKMSELYIEWVRQSNDLSDAVLAEQALAHAVNLSVLIAYLPDLSSVTRFARPRAIFDRWPALPRGTFKRRPWPDGSDDEPIAPEDRELLRKAAGLPNDQMFARERMRALEFCAKTPWVKREIKWPPHPPGSENLREPVDPETLQEPDDGSGEC
jgi:hypothetical protein